MAARAGSGRLPGSSSSDFLDGGGPLSTTRDGESPGGPQAPTMVELIAVSAVLFLVHAFLWSRSLPLAHQDLSFYVEPAVLLAEQGWIAGPSSLNIDLTYTRGMYFYPPGFTLFLGAWIRLFGYTAGSLVAYTNAVHLLYLLGLWIVLRVKFRSTLLASVLALVSAFPLFNHGRPDLTALMLGVLAWLALPLRPSWGRSLLAGVLLGLAVLVSPPFGLSSAAAVGAYYALTLQESRRRRLAWFGMLTGSAILTFVGTWALVLTWQDAWSFGVEQFTVNSSVRAAELNAFPPPSFYLLVFAGIPLGLLTLLPVAAALIYRPLREDRRLRISILAYLAGFVTWFALSRTPLITGAHHAYLARPVFHGALASTRGFAGRLGVLIVLAFSAVHWYLQKDSWLALLQDFSGFDRSAAQLAVPTVDVIGVDSDAFPHFYREASSVNYETMDFDYWVRYQAETSPSTLERLGLESCSSPELPGAVVISSRTLMNFGPPDPDIYAPAAGSIAPIERMRILGRAVAFPNDPATLHLFVRSSESVRATDTAGDCDLLPATRIRLTD